MRLSAHDRKLLRTAIYRADPQARAWLFGSRVNADARGGDIDLVVLSKRIDLMAKLDLLAQWHQQMGDQRIDLVVAPDDSPTFVRMAIASGVEL
jgi:uncharacterized protein